MPKLLLGIFFSLICSNVFANITQGHWRWRNNDGTETSATWKAGQDTGSTINDYKAIRLRMELYNDTSDKPFDHILQYSTSPNGPWNSITDGTTFMAFVMGGDNAYITNGTTTTQQLKNLHDAFAAGSVITTTGVPVTDTVRSKTSSEYEWCIKPTTFIQPNTTYYFKAATGDAPAVLPSLTTGDAFTAKTVLLSNGGFENNDAGWTKSTGSGSASFNILTTKNYVHSGAKAIKVSVSNASTLNSIKLSHTLTLDTTKRYLVRFWSISETQNALLNLNVKSAAGDNLCAFKIYNRFGSTDTDGWQMYQYAFKPARSNVSLDVTFNSNAVYYLDDFEIISEDDSVVDVATQYNWQYNQGSYGWLSGDNDNSVLLPDSSVAWIFSDSFVGTTDAHSNIVGSKPIINNIIVHETKDHHFTSYYGGTQSSPQALFSPGNGHVFWNSGGVVEGGNLRVILMEISGDSYISTYIGSISLKTKKVTGQLKAAYTGTNAPNTIFTDGGYHYIYLSEHVGTFENYSQVARVPVGKLYSSTQQWEFYKNDNTWSTGYTNVKRIIGNVEAASVVKLGDGNYALSGVPNLSSEIDVWFASSPVGPWINKTVVNTIPQEDGVLAYEGHIDKGTGKNGVYTFSYSVYPFSGLVPQQQTDKGIYIPYYNKANLLQLSPFTPAALKQPSFTFNVTKQNNQVVLNWKTAGTYSYFTVQRSSDNKSWKNIGKVSYNANGTYTFADANFASGLNYYRIKMVDEDNKINTSVVRSINMAAASNITAGHLNKTTINVFPNPAKDVIQFSLNICSTSKMNVVVTDVAGKQVAGSLNSNDAINSYYRWVPSVKLVPGVYVISVLYDGQRQSANVVIQ